MKQTTPSPATEGQPGRSQMLKKEQELFVIAGWNKASVGWELQMGKLSGSVSGLIQVVTLYFVAPPGSGIHLAATRWIQAPLLAANDAPESSEKKQEEVEVLKRHHLRCNLLARRGLPCPS